MLCSSVTILQQHPPGVKVTSLPCKCWGCAPCAEVNKAKLKRRAYAGFPTKFLTATVNPAIGINPDHRAGLLRDAWQKVVRQIKQKYKGQEVEYLVVFEKTKKGEPHIHVLLRSQYIPQPWLKMRFEQEIQAHQVNIKEVKNKKAVASYVAKYMAKDPEKFPGCKRFWTSKHWQLLEEIPWKNPDGEPIRQWVELMAMEEVIEKYTKKFYREERFDLKHGPEVWLVDDWPTREKERPTPQEGTGDLFESVASGVHPWSAR
jgi:hypothetical protein